MNESEFLQAYDPSAFARPSLAVDLVLMTVSDGAPAALLIRRDSHPFQGCWTLPGGFVGIGEGLDAAARRVLAEKAGLADAWIEQLYTFGAVDRDPRMRIVSVSYFALLPVERFAGVVREDRRLARLSLVADGSASADGLPLGFDHGAILGMALQRLRGKLDWSDIAFALLPERFTLRALQQVHEAILGVRLNKPAFRRRLLDSGRIRATGDRETGAAFRPAELYTLVVRS